jgi:hypothetical protein
MKLSDAGWPVHFTINELKVLWTLADNKGHSAKEIRNKLVNQEPYQKIKSESLIYEDNSNLSNVLRLLYNHNIIYYEKINTRGTRAKRDYLTKFYYIAPTCYDIIRNVAHNLKEEAERETLKVFDENTGLCQNELYQKAFEKETLYKIIELTFENMIDYFNKEYYKSLQALKEGNPVVSMSWSPALADLMSIAKLIEPHCKSRLNAELAAFELHPELVEANWEWQRAYGYVSEASKKLHEASLRQNSIR